MQIDFDPAGCLMSEKLDGVNATWNGRELVSRDGNVFPAPDWFTAGLPAIPLVGELWVGRGQFERTVSIVRNRESGERWREVRYMVFETPYGLPLGPHAAYVEQIPCRGVAELRAFYRDVLAAGGEGVMVRDRNGECHKIKPVEDSDAVVVGYHPGRGRHSGRVGALCVRDRAGREFRVGNGLADTDRVSPPPIGSVVRYFFQGRTARGIPRFASFAGCRAELRI